MAPLLVVAADYLVSRGDLNDHLFFVRFLQNEFELEYLRRVGGARSTDIDDLEKNSYLFNDTTYEPNHLSLPPNTMQAKSRRC